MRGDRSVGRSRRAAAAVRLNSVRAGSISRRRPATASLAPAFTTRAHLVAGRPSRPVTYRISRHRPSHRSHTTPPDRSHTTPPDRSHTTPSDRNTCHPSRPVSYFGHTHTDHVWRHGSLKLFTEATGHGLLLTQGVRHTSVCCVLPRVTSC